MLDRCVYTFKNCFFCKGPKSLIEGEIFAFWTNMASLLFTLVFWHRNSLQSPQCHYSPGDLISASLLHSPTVFWIVVVTEYLILYLVLMAGGRAGACARADVDRKWREQEVKMLRRAGEPPTCSSFLWSPRCVDLTWIDTSAGACDSREETDKRTKAVLILKTPLRPTLPNK